MSKPLKTRGIVNDFKAFINRGSVVDVAVAFVMGATFKTVIDAVAGDGKDNQGILGGLVGAVFGGNRPNFNDKGVTVSTVMFFVIKAYGRFHNAKTEETTNDLLASIRDELRKQNKN